MKGKQHKGKTIYFTYLIFSSIISRMASQTVQVSPSPILVIDEENEEEEEDEETIVPVQEMPIIEDKRPPLNRPVQVDALLETWRTQIRNAGVKTEEIFLDAIQDIFGTEKERESSITENMILELENTVASEIASLENTIIYLAKKGRASEQDDPRLKELNKSVVASGKRIRNHAVEIRYPNLIIPGLILH